MSATPLLANVNGVRLLGAHETLDAETLRQRACTELVRQAAQRAALLPVGDAPASDGSISAAAADAIERLLDHALQVPDPSEDACRRHYAANRSLYGTGERVLLRHVLFAVTPGVNVAALRQRAEALLFELRAASAEGSAFSEVAARWSNCPSGCAGGDLGWLTDRECAPEFARQVFGQQTIGVLPRLVRSRFGFHLIEIRARQAATVPPYEQVSAAVAATLRQQAWISALQHYLQSLIAQNVIEGVAFRWGGCARQPAQSLGGKWDAQIHYSC